MNGLGKAAGNERIFLKSVLTGIKFKNRLNLKTQASVSEEYHIYKCIVLHYF